MKFLLLACAIFFSSHLVAGALYETLPEKIDNKAFYVFYSHGFIVEGDNPKPVHPRWGVYDFPAVKAALSDPSYHLIATHRASKTNPFDYAKSLVQQVTRLIDAGVPASNISLVGFSRGGFITAITSSLLANRDINFVILAACTSGLSKNKDIVITGHLFSIFETSDTVGSCDQVVARNPALVSSYKEIAITTGKEHGAFYRPDEVWVEPVKRWLKR